MSAIHPDDFDACTRLFDAHQTYEIGRQRGLLEARAAYGAAMPAGFTLMPKALTAENGAKAALTGEFNIQHEVTCSGCAYDEADEDCEVCGGEVQYTEFVTVPWTTIKEIYAAAVVACAVPQGDAGTRPATDLEQKLGYMAERSALMLNERDRLRAALEQIASNSLVGTRYAHEQMQRIAREALDERDGAAPQARPVTAGQREPAAYAVFADNGNVICFSTQRNHPSLAKLIGEGSEVIALAPITGDVPELARAAVAGHAANQEPWKSPQDAPRDRLILADMGWPWTSLVIWNEPAGQWCATQLEADLYQGEWNDTVISHNFEPHTQMRGWMELPAPPKQEGA